MKCSTFPAIRMIAIAIIALVTLCVIAVILAGCSPIPSSPEELEAQARGMREATSAARVEEQRRAFATQAAVQLEAQAQQSAAQATQSAYQAQAAQATLVAIGTAQSIDLQSQVIALRGTEVSANATNSAIVLQSTQAWLNMSNAAQATATVSAIEAGAAQARATSEIAQGWMWRVVLMIPVGGLCCGASWLLFVLMRQVLTDVGDRATVGRRAVQVEVENKRQALPAPDSRKIEAFLVKAARAAGWHSKSLPRHDKMGVSGGEWMSVTEAPSLRGFLDKSPAGTELKYEWTLRDLYQAIQSGDKPEMYIEESV